MSNPNRVTSGIPTGGQFAATQRGEADVDLGADPWGPPTPVASSGGWTDTGDQATVAQRNGHTLTVRPFPGSPEYGYEYRVRDGNGNLIAGGLSRTAEHAQERATLESDTTSAVETDTAGMIARRAAAAEANIPQTIPAPDIGEDEPEPEWEVRPEQRQEIARQIGNGNIMSISGGRVRPIKDGIELPVSNGFSVRVHLEPDDTYRVERIFKRGSKEWVKGSRSNVYCDDVSELSYRAGMFHSYDEDEW